MDTRINANKGTVMKISKDRTEITLRLPRGGEIICPNEGFTIGDRVCFIKNAVGKIVKVMSEELADLKAELANNEFLGLPKFDLPKKAQYPKQLSMLDIILNDEEEPKYDTQDESNECDGFEDEISAHRSSGEYGEGDS